MEIASIILTFLGIVFLRWLLGAGAATATAAANAARGRGSFSENMELQFKGMTPLGIRFHDKHLGDDGSGPLVREIQARGLIPVFEPARIAFVTSVLDSDEGQPVISALEMFQEPDTVIFQNSVEVGNVSPGQGFITWVRIGVVIPEVLTPPYSGRRKLIVAVRMVDAENWPPISLGRCDKDHPGLLWQNFLQFEHEFEEKGYQEAAQHRDEARVLCIALGVAVAMADRSLDNSEGEVLRGWILKCVAPFSDAKQIELKKLYNDAMRNAFAEAKRNELSLTAITARLNEIGEKSIKYEALELCFDVLAADGVADAEELRTAHRIAEALGLDLDEVERMRDQKIVGLDSKVSGQADVESLLGIEPDWERERIRKHLRQEFQKWNNRLNTLPEGTERENAQVMIDRIAEARQRYD